MFRKSKWLVLRVLTIVFVSIAVVGLDLLKLPRLQIPVYGLGILCYSALLLAHGREGNLGKRTEDEAKEENDEDLKHFFSRTTDVLLMFIWIIAFLRACTIIRII